MAGPVTHTRSVTTGRLRALFAAEGIAFGLSMPFLVPLLDDRGLDAAAIGLALGAAGVASLLAYPAWGAVADGPLGRRRTIALTSVTAATGGLLILAAGSDPLLITLAISVAILGALPWGPLIDALTLQELAEPSAAYGRVRAWASVGWAASAIIGGAVWQIVGPAPVFVAFSASALLVAALVLMPATRHSTPAPDPPAPGPTGPSRGTDAGSLPAKRTTSWLLAQLAAVASPMLVGFLAGVFVTSIGEHATWRFIGLRILDQGGGVFLVGLAAALPAIVEIPVFGSSRRLLARLGLRLMYVWGALIAAVLALLVALAPEAWMVTTLRALDGTSYALRYMAMVVIIGALIPVHLHALGQSLTWLVYAGVAPIVADIAGGLVYEQLGAAALFVAAMLMLLTGGIVVWLALRGPRFGRGASGSVVVHEVEAVALPPPV
jgi:PPP family 3-phenylpropionic acid transporter